MIILGITIVSLTIVLVTGTIPTKVFVDDKGVINMKTILWTARKIPRHDAILIQGKTTIPPLVRVCGTSVCGRSSGWFYDFKGKKFYYLFLTGKNKSIMFEYNGKTYVVDQF